MTKPKGKTFTHIREKQRPHDRLYNCTRWREASKSFLYKHPLCVICQDAGLVTTSAETDHRIPHKGDEKLFWDPSNWQALCKKCHSIKTASETRSVSKFPIIKHKPRCRVIMVCGPSGSGRMEYAQSLGPLTIVDSSANSDGGRYEHQSSAHRTYAWVEFLSRLDKLSTISSDQFVCVLLNAPTYAERRHWMKQLGVVPDDVVVLHCCAERVPEQLRSLAFDWHTKYTAGVREKTLMMT